MRLAFSFLMRYIMFSSSAPSNIHNLDTGICICFILYHSLCQLQETWLRLNKLDNGNILYHLNKLYYRTSHWNIRYPLKHSLFSTHLQFLWKSCVIYYRLQVLAAFPVNLSTILAIPPQPFDSNEGRGTPGNFRDCLYSIYVICHMMAGLELRK